MADAQHLEGVALWRAVCAAFFKVADAGAPTWPVPVLQGTMESVLAADIGEEPAPAAPSAGEAADLEAGDGDEVASAISTLLWGLGARRASALGPWCLSPALRSEMDSIKNEVRKEAHRRQTRARIEAYHCACAAFIDTAQGRVAAPSGQAMESATEASQRLAMVQSFSQRWRADAATHSFINGLIRALKAQRDEPHHCVRWIVNDVVFVEHPDVQGFTGSALELLVIALGFSSESLGGSPSQQAKSSLEDQAFVASASLSNPRIVSILRRLPAESSMTGACHGVVEITDICRTNTNGVQDGDHSNFWMCQVL